MGTGRPKKFSVRNWRGRDDPTGARLPGAKREPGPVRKTIRAWRDGRKINKQYAAKQAVLQEAYGMSNGNYDPKKSVAAGAKQVTNTAGSGGMGALAAGLIYGLLPDTMDPDTRLQISGAAGVLVTVGTSYLWGWWRNRQKHA
jgi:hypothetical protein